MEYLMADHFEEQEWYVLMDNKEHEGPLSLRDIDALYKTMAVRSSSLVWKEGMDEWQQLFQIDTLKKLINDAVEEADNIPGIDDAPQESSDKKDTKKKDMINAEDIGIKRQPSKDEVEKLAEEAMQQLIEKPEQDLTEEEKEQEKQKILRKEKKKRYRKNKSKKKWYKAKINTNIYIQGLPDDITHEELIDHFGKWGAIRLDPNTGRQKIKIYTGDDEKPKGDALISFENIESVETAIDMLNESNIRSDCKIVVTPAEFEQKGDEYRERKRQKIDAVEKKRIQAESDRRFAFTKEQAESIGLKIVILKHLFDPEEVKDNDQLFQEIEVDVKTEIEQSWGEITKMEIFRENPEGAIKIKFENTLSAEKWVDIMNGRIFDGREVKAEFWDGKTNFRRADGEDIEKRVNEFGDWLNEQELPEELKQRKQTDDTPSEPITQE